MALERCGAKCSLDRKWFALGKVVEFETWRHVVGAMTAYGSRRVVMTSPVQPAVRRHNEPAGGASSGPNGGGFVPGWVAFR